MPPLSVLRPSRGSFLKASKPRSAAQASKAAQRSGRGCAAAPLETLTLQDIPHLDSPLGLVRAATHSSARAAAARSVNLNERTPFSTCKVCARGEPISNRGPWQGRAGDWRASCSRAEMAGRWKEGGTNPTSSCSCRSVPAAPP